MHDDEIKIVSTSNKTADMTPIIILDETTRTVIEQNSERQLIIESVTPSNDGLTIVKGKLAIKNDDSQIATYIVNLTVPFLVAAVALFVVDIVIRKLKWKDIVSLFGGARNKKGGGK